MKRLLTILFFVTLCVITGGIACANLVTNGNFQTIMYGSDGTEIIAPSWDGWSRTDAGHGSNYYIGGIPGPSMYQAVFAGPGPDSDSIGQTIQTVAGKSYSFSFWLAQPYDLNNNYSPGSLKAYWNETPVLDITEAVQLGWTEYIYTVLATGSSSTIAFSGRANTRWDDARGYFLTAIDVSPTAVPIPGPMALLGSGLFSLMALRRFNK
ncbi:MAG: hypothetical protein NT010_16510 [Proteobacteria bacterium]|nr:hypothetical protein [Pseudomonadota bacterium]